MSALIGSRILCPFCEATTLFRQTCRPPIRLASTLQKRKPSRMVLSDRVGRSSPEALAARGRPARKSKNSPFGGMNRTEVPRELVAFRQQVSAAEAKRASRHAKPRREDKPRDPMKALKMQRRLAAVSYEKRTRVKQELEEYESFDDFDLLPIVRESIASQALGGMINIAPTPVQRLSIPALLEQKDRGRRKKSSEDALETEDVMRQYLLAAETGSGKTLAYALPVIDAVKRTEAAERYSQQAETAQKQIEMEGHPGARQFELETPGHADTNPARPKAIVLVPTAELVAQVGAVFKSLSHHVKFRTAMISAAYTPTVIRSRLYSSGSIDVVVATPHLLSSIARTDPDILSHVTHLVIDEADSLLDRSFAPITSEIVDKATPSLEKLVFCSATIPKSLDSYLNKRYPFTKRLATPNLHAIPRRVQLSVVDIDQIPYQGNRDLACAQTIWDIGKEAAEVHDREKKIVVFVNEREESVRLAEYMRGKGIDAIAFSRDSDDRKQAEVLAAFTSIDVALPREDAVESRSTLSAGRRQLQNAKVLVMTDIGSRGIDTIAVRDVILYDVPHTSIDFIHRLGRLGRMGRRGRGVVLVGRNDRKDIVREVRDGMHRGQALI